MTHFRRDGSPRPDGRTDFRRALTLEETARLTEAKEAHYRELCLAQGDTFTLSPGARELLDWLVAQGVPRAIATSSERTNVAFFTRHLGLEAWFATQQIVYDDGSLPGKPAPDIYLRAAARLGLPPEDCIVVEDAPSGIAAGHRRRARCRHRPHHRPRPSEAAPPTSGAARRGAGDPEPRRVPARPSGCVLVHGTAFRAGRALRCAQAQPSRRQRHQQVRA